MSVTHNTKTPRPGLFCLIAVSVGGLLSVACPGCHSETTSPPTKSESESADCVAFASAACRAIQRCAEPLSDPGVSGCTARVEAVCLQGVQAHTSSLASGAQILEPDAFQACIDWLDEVICIGSQPSLLVFSTPGTPCHTVYTPTLAVGESCANDGDCPSGAECELGVDAECSGICVTAPPPTIRLDEGAACSADSECKSALHCGPSGGCEADLALGTECVRMAECEPTAFCSASEICESRGAAGGVCGDDRPCVSSSYCDAAGICVQYPIFPGEPCISVSNNACPAFPALYCDITTALCEARIAVGQECQPTDAPCRFGHCDPASEVCEPLAKVGAPCGSSAACGSRECTAGACAAPPQPQSCALGGSTPADWAITAILAEDE